MKQLARLSLFVLFLIKIQIGYSQKTYPQNGVYDERERLYAFTNATIYKSWNEKVENATLLIRNGRIEAIGQAIAVPKDAAVIDLKGKSIYPSFIEPHGNYGMPEMPQRQGGGPGGGGGRQAQQLLTNKKGAYAWNEALKSEFKAHEAFNFNEKEVEILRGVGFGAVVTHRMDGISRGASSVVTTANDREHNLIIKPMAAHVMSFSKGTSTQNYPSSLMGGIALLRQTYLDGQWYATEGGKEEKNISLEAWNALQNLPQVFEVGDKLEALRALAIAKEFGKNYIIKGRGDEYQRLDALKAAGASFILPLNFPEASDVEDPYDALNVNLSDMKHWEMAPGNAARLAGAGMTFTFTTHLLRDKKDLFKQIQKAIENGLTEGDALKALTMTPATLFGVQNEVGSLEKGKVANFLITSGNIFSKDSKILHNWVQGKGYVINELDKPDLKGTYTLSVGDKSYKMVLGAENTIFRNDTAKVKAELTTARRNVNLTFNTPETGWVRMSGIIAGNAMSGQAQLSDGSWVNWKALPVAETVKADAVTSGKKPNAASDNNVGDMIYPFTAFGRKELPKATSVLIKNATVWTNETEGVLKNTDVLLENGKISKIGKNITAAAGVTTVDGTNKHLTAGVIDEHSHIGISRGVNEGTQASSAEVRIADVLNSDDVNIYRQLAGGVTSSHLLHGSANPIGGQTQLIKLRWGVEPEKLKFENWPGYIKFALGENVKQSNWDISANERIRFPQSRMGVEQVYDDHFTRAKEYLALKKSGKPYRRDLDLEALGEILEGKRHITCHSYVQSEINMLLHVADRHDFKVNTFTHILEGYKVAEKMAKHGAAGAGFADWWAYKNEVYDAIPQNAALMARQGVLASINSDDAEMARRLNQEAAKSVMYANMNEEEAWKLVTLNPAKTLRVADRVGSIKIGKDADVVLWSDNPLSIYAKAEQTYVDGVKYFDRQEDVQLREYVKKERARLVQKMIAAKKNGAPTMPVQVRTQHLYDCEDDEDEMRD